MVDPVFGNFLGFLGWCGVGAIYFLAGFRVSYRWCMVGLIWWSWWFSGFGVFGVCLPDFLTLGLAGGWLSLLVVWRFSRFYDFLVSGFVWL